VDTSVSVRNKERKMVEQTLTPEKTSVEKEGPPLSVRGLWEVFTSPTCFFDEIRQNPKVLVPLIAIAVTFSFFLYFTADIIAQTQIAEMRQKPNMPADQIPTVDSMKMYIWIFSAPVIILSPLIITALAMFWGNFVMAGKATFKQIFSVAVYGEYAFFVASLVVIPLIIAKGSMAVSLSPAILLSDQDITNPLWLALSKLSVFHILEFIIIAIGCQKIYLVSRNKGYLLSVLSMGLIALLHVITTAIGKLFT